MRPVPRPLAGLRAVRVAGGYERWSRKTAGPLLAFAVAFVVVLLLSLFPHPSPAESLAIAIANVVIWAVFAVDYAVRLYLAPRRWHFVRTHLLDLVIVVLPMLRPLRALRLVQVLRLGTVAALAHKRASRTLHVRVTAYVVSAVVVSLIVSAFAIREAERGSPDANIRTFWDGLWWAASTVTTVGYGDRYPTTTLGRLIALALMLVGIALLGVVTAAIATWFVDRLRSVETGVLRAEQRTDATLEDVLTELRELRSRLDTMERQRMP